MDIIDHFVIVLGTNNVQTIVEINNNITSARPEKFELTIKFVKPETITFPILEYLNILINAEPAKT